MKILKIFAVVFLFIVLGIQWQEIKTLKSKHAYCMNVIERQSK